MKEIQKKLNDINIITKEIKENLYKSKFEQINKDTKVNSIHFKGIFENNDNTKSNFAIDININTLTNLNIENVSIILNAFGNAERMKIILLLLKKGRNVNEIVEELKFNTTGKAYHHLNPLINAGFVIKSGNIYKFKAKYIQGILAILLGCNCLSHEHREETINLERLKE